MKQKILNLEMKNGEAVAADREMKHGEAVAADRGAQGKGSVIKASMNCLPNDILVKILSLLPTKEAASTSLISTRWRNLFASRHDLDFDDSNFLQPEEGKRNRVEIQKCFKDFVDRTLALQGIDPIKKFSLKCEDDHHGRNHVDSWICNALEHGVSELHLGITCQSQKRRLLPSKVFTSTTLVKLSLGTKLSLDSFPSDTSLPSLKALFIDTIWFEIEEFNVVFLAACPLLEELSIRHESFPGRQDVISSKTIKTLSVSYKCPNDVDWNSFMTLDMPSLVQLYLSDFALREYLDFDLDSLVEATLDLHLLEAANPRDQVNPNVTDLINGIRKVKTLHLTSSAVEVISVCCSGGLPVLENLLHLTFSTNTEQGWKVLLPLLLEHSPNLDTLVLSGLDHLSGTVGISIPANNQVKTLHIMEYRGTRNEMEHISSLLLQMEGLQVASVYVASGITNVKQLTEDLSKLPASPSKIKIKMQLV